MFYFLVLQKKKKNQREDEDATKSRSYKNGPEYPTLISFATNDFPLPGGPLKIITILGGLFCLPGVPSKSSTIVKFGVFGSSMVFGGSTFLSTSTVFGVSIGFGETSGSTCFASCSLQQSVSLLYDKSRFHLYALYYDKRNNSLFYIQRNYTLSSSLSKPKL